MSGSSSEEGASGVEGTRGAEGGAFPVGSAVRLNASLPYLKTADPMPMLRPPDLIDPGETGLVVECRALGVRAVRFRRGTFLIDEVRLSGAAPEAPDPR